MQAARNISLRNGSISTKFQPAVIMAHRWNGDNQRFDGKKVGGHFLLGARLTDSRGDIERYESTDYVLENLTLTSDQIVVLMQGKNNIIRRCKIIGANAAVNLYGPNLVFEDNEIVMTARDPADAGGEPQVALYVEDGFGAVIRNNRFVIKGRPDGAVAMNSGTLQESFWRGIPLRARPTCIEPWMRKAPSKSGRLCNKRLL